MAEDAALLLQDVVGSLDNLPSEISFLLQEIGHKEGKTNDLKNRAMARDQSIQRHARPTAQGGQGLLVPNPKEEALVGKIRLDLDRAEAAAKEKVALSERGVNLLSRHLNRLQSQLELLTPNVPPLPVLPSFNVPAASIHAPHAAAPSSHYGGVGSAAAAQAANAYNPTAHTGQFVNPYAQGYAQQYGYGGSPAGVDKRKLPGQAGSPPGVGGQIPLLPAGQGAQAPGFPYSSQSPIAPASNVNRQARPSRLSYPGTPNGLAPGQGQAGTPLQHAQLQQQQLAQHQHLQQQQLRLAQQAQALAQQQMVNQQHIQALQQGHQHHGGAGSAANKKRARAEEEEMQSVSAAGEEAEGEDMTPYCFCHRPSFGEMIGCDAPDCAIEWFHLACVGLKTVPPEGASWYCRDCKAKQEQKSQGGGRRRK